MKPRFSSKCQHLLAIVLGVTLCTLALSGFAQNQTSPAGAATTSEGASEANQKIQETGQATVEKIQTLWQRIDERRLKNRTPDQLVAWVIMGLLVGGLLGRFGKRNQLVSILLGLVGAFIGGILANVTQLNLGLGPVLITYEDLLFTLVGGILILCVARWSALSGLFKRPVS